MMHMTSDYAQKKNNVCIVCNNSTLNYVILEEVFHAQISTQNKKLYWAFCICKVALAVDETECTLACVCVCDVGASRIHTGMNSLTQ